MPEELIKLKSVQISKSQRNDILWPIFSDWFTEKGPLFSKADRKELYSRWRTALGPIGDEIQQNILTISLSKMIKARIENEESNSPNYLRDKLTMEAESLKEMVLDDSDVRTSKKIDLIVKINSHIADINNIQQTITPPIQIQINTNVSESDMLSKLNKKAVLITPEEEISE